MSGYMQTVQAVFPLSLCTRIANAVQQHPKPNELAQLFEDIAHTVQSPTQNGSATTTNTKKRKLEDGTAANATNGTTVAGPLGDAVTCFECKDVSFQIPARKKMRLQLVGNAKDKTRQEVRIQNQQTNGIEHTLPASQIDEVFCLPVPEKQQRQWNFVLFPKPGATNASGVPCEQVLFTMNEVPPTGATSAEHQATETDTFVTLTELELNRMLHYQGKRVAIPDVAEFVSSVPQSHRKGEKAYHVKAHRGSKDGYLFFLPNGIVFGFRKPVAFFAFSAIDSISYTSVLQRTFNLVISARETPEAEPKDIEFSMIDQVDFAGIDEYIKRHELNDASMAADRRAKAYNVNKDKKAESTGDAVDGAEGDDGQTELQKAEQALQDQEDDEEEDYDPSGGESEGEGEDSDEDEEEYGDAGDEEGAEEFEHEEDVEE